MHSNHSSRQTGIALVSVVLIGAVALMTMLFASAMLSLSSRKSASSERNSTQALLAADSGLGTLKARASLAPFTGGTFAAWVDSNFATLDMGGGVTATLRVVAEDADFLTIESVGRVGSFTRTVLQDYTIRRGPPLPISVSVPGALTSVSKIASDSNALCVNGRNNTVADWTITKVITAWDNGNVGDCNAIWNDNTKKVVKRPAVLCDAFSGQYVTVANVLYRITATPASWAADCKNAFYGSPAELTPVGGGPAILATGDAVAAIRATSITEQLVVRSGTPKTSVVEVTEGTPSLFGVGMPITIGNDSSGNPSSGKVVAVEGNTLTISWDAGREPSGFQGEGAIVRRAISSGVSDISSGGCQIGQTSTFPQQCITSDLVGLFKSTFGVSRDDLFNSLRPEQKISKAVATSGQLLSGLNWVTLSSQDNDTKFGGQRGSGILIIDATAADVSKPVNLNVDNGYDGLIYVIGNAKINGNAQYRGAIIVEGYADLLVDTATQGTGGILYDPLQLLKALAGITVPNPVAGELGLAVPTSWRIK